MHVDCGYSLDRLAEVVLTSTHNLYFEQKYEKYHFFFYLKIFIFFFFSFLEVNFSIYLNRRVFRNTEGRF